MASTIDNAFVQQFKANVVHLAQQRGSRLENTVIKETLKGETHNFERIGSTSDEAKTTRHKATPVADTPHSRRKVTLATYHWADLIDNDDKIKMLINPESEYVKAGAFAMGRRKDSLIIAAALANATDGDGNAVTFDANNVVATGSAGMTLQKLLDGREILLANDVDEEMDPITCVISSQELHALLADTTLTSADYNSVKALVNGEINTFLGMNFVRTQLLATAGSPAYRSCLMYCKSGIGLAVGQDVITSIDKRPDKSNAMQVYLEYNAQATRIEEEKVVEIRCLTA